MRGWLSVIVVAAGTSLFAGHVATGIPGGSTIGAGDLHLLEAGGGATQEGLLGCQVFPYEGEALPSADAVLDLRGGAECRVLVHVSLPAYVFHLVADSENHVRSIELRDGTRTIQTLAIDVNDFEPPYRGADFFGAEDVDFDGYQDIKLLSWWGVTGNKGYIWWLFDPKKRVFVRNDALRGLSNPVLDPVAKTIETSGVGGMAGRIYRKSTYQLDGKGVLVETRNEYQDWDAARKCFVRIVSERKNGRLQVVSREYVKY
jgi:hypothetical protein